MLVEVDEDTTRVRRRPTSPARSSWTGIPFAGPVRRDFVNKEQFEALLGERGISIDDTVVLYGGNNNWFAAYRIRISSCTAPNAKLLDGGRKKWELDGRELWEPVTWRAPATRRRKPTGIRAFRDEASPGDRHKEPGGCRGPDELPVGPWPRRICPRAGPAGGHIPTAINVPWSKAANDDGTFKSDDALTVLGDGRRRPYSTGHDRLLPYRRAVRPHLVGAAGPPRGPEREEFRRSWTGRLAVGVPVAVGVEPGVGDVRPLPGARRAPQSGSTTTLTPSKWRNTRRGQLPKAGLSVQGIDVATKEAVIPGPGAAQR